MKFLAVDDGYLNMAYVRRLYVRGVAIYAETDTGAEYTHDDDFDCEEAAQGWLDDLIKELEKDDGV
ncbi:MAG: hypothetical protein IJG33_13360 [Selenomonadaceae bacterium]|nr:hypothetical protein [Selenomonadaceae bacterium]